MIVLKFGGSSVGSADNIRKVVEIINKYEHEGNTVIVVSSAMQGVTNQLIETGTLAAQNDEGYKYTIKNIEKRHFDTVKELINVKGQSKVLAHIKKLINELEDLAHGAFLLKELSNRTRDLLLSFGERLSCYIISQYAMQESLNIEYVDARELILTDDNFGNARIYKTETFSRIQDNFIGKSGTYIVTGFISSTTKGETTTLGRGGSDYTASIMGAALDAEAIEIWTDVDGVMTTDPRKVKRAFPLKEMSYIEAMEMSHFGAKVIYPPTLQPAFTKKIPLRIKNTFNPEFEGTLIHDKSNSGDFVIKGISSIQDVALINLQGSGMVGVPGVSSRLFGQLARNQISIILITQASSEHSICFALDPKDALIAKDIIDEEFALEISNGKIDKVIVEQDLSIVAIIGENMRNTPGISGKMFNSLGKNGVNVVAIAQGSSELNLSVVINQHDLSKTLNTLHEVFFLSDVKTLNVFMVGVGLIGGTLINQIAKQYEYLLNEQLIKINVIALSNSRKMHFDEEGININDWKAPLENAEVMADMGAFVDTMVEMNLQNSVFVDCTSSGHVVKYYEKILNNAISITTPNKLASSGEYKLYKELKNSAFKHGIKYLFETNVGAGLPVITTLNDLKNSGDKVIKIEGVLSGTLSYIFNTYKKGDAFSDVVKMAKENGYTEPDPRDDLNGMDVARKILILSREVGYELELSDVNIENILPESCLNATDVDDFFVELEKANGFFAEMLEKADTDNKVLRFIARMEDGNADIKLQMVDNTNPFYTLSGSDNMIAFTTERYKECPLVIKGPGAGAEVTAAGVFAELISISHFLG